MEGLQLLWWKLKIVYSVLCLLVCQFWGKYFCCFLFLCFDPVLSKDVFMAALLILLSAMWFVP